MPFKSSSVSKSFAPKCPPQRSEAQREDSVVLSKSEYTEMLKLITNEHSGAERKREVEEERNRTTNAAMERKLRMQAIDEERRSKGVVKPQEEVEKDKRRQEDIEVSKKKVNEEIDEVKFMNQVMLYAKCVTVRDAQIMEKKVVKAERSEEERRMDMMMELERLKALRMYEEREAKRVEDRKKGAAVIRAQIEEREQEAMRKLELKQQEQDAMLSHIEKMKEDDILETLKKKEAAKHLMEDVALANAEQIRLKARQREMEQEEEHQIANYIKERERRDQEIADEQLRQKAEKEHEIARLRSMQEKAQDKQAELDALRARRTQEAYERGWRQQEREAAQRAAAINADLAKAREKQMKDKEHMLAEQAIIEKDDFEKIIAVQRIEDDMEAERREKEMMLRHHHAEQLKKQIDEIEEKRRKERREFLEEGNKLKLERRDRESTIDSIRIRKLDELEKLQVPKQYRQELMKKKATEPLRPAK